MHVFALTLCIIAQNPEQQPAMIRAGAWLPRLGGIIQDGGGEIDFETNIDLRTKESVPLLEFSLIPVSDITMSFLVFDFSTSGSGLFRGNELFGSVAMSDGDRWSADASVQSVGFEAAWDVLQPFHASDLSTLTFAPVAGLQWYGVDTRLQNITLNQTVLHENSWVSLQGGLEMRFDWNTRELTNLLDSISIDAKLLVGTLFGDDGGSMWSVHAGLTAHFSPNVAGYFGYRLQELNAEDGNYTFDAGLQGLFVGGVIRF